MKFDGQSAVEVHPQTNLDELKTVTSISFYIRVDPDKDPIEDRFLLYLGDKQVSGRNSQLCECVKYWGWIKGQTVWTLKTAVLKQHILYSVKDINISNIYHSKILDICAKIQKENRAWLS